MRPWLGLSTLMILTPAALAGAAETKPLSLKAAVLQAESYSPGIKAALAAVQKAQAAITVSRSYLIPNLEAQGTDEKGYIGSPGPFPLQGIAGSPFKFQPSGALTSSLDLNPQYPFAIWAAYKDLDTAKAKVLVERYLVDQQAINYYFAASFERGLQDVWRYVENQLIDPLYTTVKTFVSNGQVNPQDLYLLEDQRWIARYGQASALVRYDYNIEKLGILLGIDSGTVAVPAIDMVGDLDINVFTIGKESPYITRAVAAAKAADVRVKQKIAQYFPEVGLTGAWGGEGNSIPGVSKQSYTADFEVRVPIFEGLRYYGEHQEAKHFYERSAFLVGDARIYVGEGDASFDKEIEDSKVRLSYYIPELKTDRKAFRLSRYRYLAFQGPLVDVREAIRDIGDTLTRIERSRRDLYAGAASKEVWDGGRPTP